MLMCFGFSSGADEVLRRDPFVSEKGLSPQLGQPGSVSPLKKDATSIHFYGAVGEGKERLALINDEALSVGSMYREFRIKAIYPDRVVLTSKSGSRIVRLNEK